MQKFFSFLLVLTLFINPISFASDVTSSALQEEISQKQEFDYTQVSEEFIKLEENIKNNTLSKEDLDSAQNYLNNKDIELSTLIKDIEKNAKFTQEALSAIGTPTEGEIEDPSITEMREKYTQSMSYYKGKQIEINLLKTEISRLTSLISETRSHLLIGNLVSTQNTIIDTNKFIKAFNDATSFFWEIITSPITYYNSLSKTDKKNVNHNLLSVFLILIATLSFGLFLRNFIINHYGYKKTDDLPRYGQKIVVAIITAIAYGVIPSLLIGGCLIWQISNKTLLNSNFGIVLANILYYSLYITLARAITRVILAPWNGKWRLFNITDQKSERIFRAITLCIYLIGTISCIINISSYFNITEELKLLLEVTSDAIKALSIILITSRLFEETTKPTDETEDETSSQQTNEQETTTSFRIIAFATIFAFATFSISLFGYPELSTYIFNHFLLSLMLLSVFVITKKLILDLLRRSIGFWIASFKLRKRLLSKLDFAMSLIITPILALSFFYGLLRLWGVSGTFMLHILKKLVFGFKVGGIEISLIAISTGLIVFIVSFSIVRLLKNRLSNSLLNRINMDEGIKHSLISGTNFIGIIISFILAIVAMGVDLSNLAVIAGALSVGIGFGLQDVIKNLVSGIIILFERPFKVGDWVIIGGEEGKIKQINIRSTELETWTRQSVIIPNATLISNSLINLTHENNWQRQTIKVGVSYDADADIVTKLLLECAKSCKKVTKIPAPYVIFKDFGSSSLDFELRFYVSDIWSGWSASSDIRYEILRRFRENGINIAYPQIVVHQGSQDTSIKGWQSNV